MGLAAAIVVYLSGTNQIIAFPICVNSTMLSRCCDAAIWPSHFVSEQIF
jgi:hypothetical protein